MRRHSPRVRVGTSRSKAMLTKVTEKQLSVPADQNDVLSRAQKYIVNPMPFSTLHQPLNIASKSSRSSAAKQSKARVSSRRIGPGNKLHVPLTNFFLKIEDASGCFRPIVKTYSRDHQPGQPSMPVLNFHPSIPAGQCRFSAKPRASRRENPKGKRKIRPRDLVGHCTVCRTQYRNGIADHAQSPEHRRMATDSATYAPLDQVVGNMKLKLNDFLQSRSPANARN
eukprot:m.9884 g.9884  ORF g.9884 m.9884 type:complete len:225 (-) comp7047_c0_seq1:4-678(-)